MQLLLWAGRKQVMVFDDEMPRNRVTQESHGFITNDGVTPFEIRQAGEADLQNYPNIQIKRSRIVEIQNHEDNFALLTQEGERFEAKKLFWPQDFRIYYQRSTGFMKCMERRCLAVLSAMAGS